MLAGLLNAYCEMLIESFCRPQLDQLVIHLLGERNRFPPENRALSQNSNGAAKTSHYVFLAKCLHTYNLSSLIFPRTRPRQLSLPGKAPRGNTPQTLSCNLSECHAVRVAVGTAI